MSAVFAMTLPGLVILLVLGAGVVAMSRTVGHGRRDHASAMPGFDVLATLLDPAERHRLEEKNREQLHREDTEEGAPPRSRVDLDSGTATIRLPAVE